MPSKKPYKFQDLVGKKIKYTTREKRIIRGLKPLVGGEWEGKIKPTSSIQRKERDELKGAIKKKLYKIQGHYCIYCGCHEEHTGMTLHREHILPKGVASYPEFMFEDYNLVLACITCNNGYKKTFDCGTGEKTNYKKNKFSIVHPYFHKFKDHIEFYPKDGNVIIRHVKYSRKGKATIKLFGLDSPNRTEKRSALIMKNEIKIPSSYDAILETILSSKYVK